MTCHCQECGAVVTKPKTSTRHKVARFCSRTCRTKFDNRRSSRGRMVYDLAMHWRTNRGDKDALSELCHQLGIFIDSDKIDGRVTFNDYTGGPPIPFLIPTSDPKQHHKET